MHGCPWRGGTIRGAQRRATRIQVVRVEDTRADRLNVVQKKGEKETGDDLDLFASQTFFSFYRCCISLHEFFFHAS